ncbi:MAG: leucine-rich repeat protein [Bacteroidales bacterium]|nr:leucine-rich repeat protein [Bacteroidales bacterium]
MEEIKAYAFYNANSLTSVTIPNSVTSIGCGAFYGCSGLSGTLTIPNSVTSIGNYAFGGCSGLTTLNFNAENCSNGSNSIGFTTLTKITIGENVATIPNYAFSGCTSLDSIISYANNPPVIYGGTFDSQLSLNTPVVVPCGMVETYEDADFWYNFRRIQQRPDCGATYTITVLSSNNAWGSVSGGGTYMAGETASLIASANEGYRFSNWSDGSTENPHNITVTQNETYIATFVVGSSLPTIYSSFSAEACGSYTWNNQTYTESGEYQQTFTAANSADSVVTLTLTILPAPQPTITLYGELDACNPSSVALVTGQYQSYLWSNGATTIATSVIEPGYYYVEVTGENGCTGISEQTNVGVSNAITEAPQISVVGMNGMNRNVVTWSAMANDNVTAYRIYRENNIANVYEPMATVVASAQTYWTDETADPSSRAFRYKVTAVDECGGESPMSDYHKTMHLTINKGIGNTWNLIWSHYEGFGFGTYRVYRGTSPSNMTMIGEVPSNLNSYTDNTATASTGFYYQVEVVRNTRDAEISSRSNIVTTEGNGIEENVTMEIALFPNPTTDILNITSSETISEIEIVNVMGQVVRRIEVNGDNAVCNVEDLKSGVYVVRIRTLRQAQGAVISQRKFVKE